jgi:Ulp1 family protease
VKKWAGNRGLDVFNVDWILVPIHLPSHWALAVIDMRTREGECRSQMESQMDLE